MIGYNGEEGGKEVRKDGIFLIRDSGKVYSSVRTLTTQENAPFVAKKKRITLLYL